MAKSEVVTSAPKKVAPAKLSKESIVKDMAKFLSSDGTISKNKRDKCSSVAQGSASKADVEYVIQSLRESKAK